LCKGYSRHLSLKFSKQALLLAQFHAGATVLGLEKLPHTLATAHLLLLTECSEAAGSLPPREAKAQGPRAKFCITHRLCVVTAGTVGMDREGFCYTFIK